MSKNNARRAVEEFARGNRKAMGLVHQGTSDYAAARCCLLNGLLSGLELAEQAVEKYLKGLALFLNPSYSKRRGHKLIKLADDIQAIDSRWSFVEERPYLQQLQEFYEDRYPDFRRMTSKSTAALTPLDILMVDLAEQMPIPDDVKYRSGLFAKVTISLEPKRPIFPDEYWLRKNNTPLSVKWLKIEQNYRDVISRLSEE